jgi:hypothetical protein
MDYCRSQSERFAFTLPVAFDDRNTESLTSVKRPGPMDGLSLARWTSHHHPGVNVILTFGNSHGRAAEVAAFFLPKPYRVAEAAHCIRSLLEDPQQGVDEGDPPH